MPPSFDGPLELDGIHDNFVYVERTPFRLCQSEPNPHLVGFGLWALFLSAPAYFCILLDEWSLSPYMLKCPAKPNLLNRNGWWLQMAVWRPDFYTHWPNPSLNTVGPIAKWAGLKLTCPTLPHEHPSPHCIVDDGDSCGPVGGPTIYSIKNLIVWCTHSFSF